MIRVSIAMNVNDDHALIDDMILLISEEWKHVDGSSFGVNESKKMQMFM